MVLSQNVRIAFFFFDGSFIIRLPMKVVSEEGFQAALAWESIFETIAESSRTKL